MIKEIFKPPRAAKILGVSPQAVREHMQRGIWKIGDHVEAKKRDRINDEYNIYRAKFEELIGRKLTEDDFK